MAAIEPGHVDREHSTRHSGHVPFAVRAAIEPGHVDREHVLELIHWPLQGFQLQLSPVMSTGNTGKMREWVENAEGSCN